MKEPDELDWEDNKQSGELEDAFDEKLLDKFEEEYEKRATASQTLRDVEEMPPPAPLDATDEVFKSGFDGSLSDGPSGFPSPEELDAVFRKELEGRAGAAEEVELDPSFSPSAAAASTAEVPEAPAGRRIRIQWGKIVVCLSTILILGGGTLLLVRTWRSMQEGKQLGVAMVRHSIPQFLREERLEFLVLARSEKKNDLLSIEIEVTMRDPNAYNFFRRRNIAVRDAIYRFLMSQPTPGNTFKYWQDLLETSLPEHLKTALPGFPTDSLRVVTLEKL